MQTVDPSLEVPGLSEKYKEYRDIFSVQRAKSLPEHRPHDLTIQIENDKAPPLGSIYSLLTLELQTLQEFLEENTKAGIIWLSKASCGAPVLFVKKKDGSLRLCVDYWGLNWITCKDRYQIPLLTDLLDAPRKVQIYSKIDLKNAYHLVCIAKGDEWKTTFCTRYGSFKWLVIPFGLLNLVYSNNLEDHKKHVKEVLRKLRDNKLYMSSTKCVFYQNRVEFLGFILGSNSLRMDKSKIQTIRDWLTSCQVRDVQSFLEFTNFYRCFINNYTGVLAPLICLT